MYTSDFLNNIFASIEISLMELWVICFKKVYFTSLFQSKFADVRPKMFIIICRERFFGGQQNQACLHGNSCNICCPPTHNSTQMDKISFIYPSLSDV